MRIFSIGMGPFILLDKSTFHSLSRQAVHGLFRHYCVVVPPVLVVEIQADHAKAEIGSKQFSYLVRKFENFSIEANISYRRLMRDNLLGKIIPMDGRPVIPGQLLR